MLSYTESEHFLGLLLPSSPLVPCRQWRRILTGSQLEMKNEVRRVPVPASQSIEQKGGFEVERQH